MSKPIRTYHRLLASHYLRDVEQIVALMSADEPETLLDDNVLVILENMDFATLRDLLRAVAES